MNHNGFTSPYFVARMEIPSESSEEHLEVNLFFNDNVHGYIGLCGCGMSPEGGLDRRYNFLKAQKKLKNKIYLDAGNAFLPRNNHDSAPLTETDFVKAREMFRFQKEFSPYIFNLGGSDLKQGLLEKEKFSKELKFVSYDSGNSNIPFFRDLSFDKLRVRVFGINSRYLSKPSVLTKALNPLLLKDRKNSLNIILSDVYSTDATSIAHSLEAPALILGHHLAGPGLSASKKGKALLDAATDYRQVIRHIRLYKGLNEDVWSYKVHGERMREKWAQKNKFSEVSKKYSQ